MSRAESTPFNMVVAVLVTCIVSSTALTVTYLLTRDRIAEQERVAEERAIRSVLPSAETFIALDEATVTEADEAALDSPVSGVFSAEDGSGNAAGWAIRVAPRGYGGPMNMVIGLDRDGKVAGVSIITQNETPGLGTKIMTEPGFLEQFEGWDGSDIRAAARSYDAISGATRSSNGVRAGVIAAGQVFSQVLSEEGGEQ